MALIDPNKTHRVDIPGEPGQWVEYRVLTTGDVEDANDKNVRLTSAKMLEAAVVAWSYDEKPSAASIRKLDLDTLNWLTPLVTDAAGMRPADEKKDSVSPLKDTSDPAEDSSPESSDT